MARSGQGAGGAAGSHHGARRQQAGAAAGRPRAAAVRRHGGWSRWGWCVIRCGAGRLQEGVGLAVIALGALRGIGQDNRASTMARLSAWDKRQIQRLQLQAERQALRLEHKAERHARTVRGAGRMARSAPRGAWRRPATPRRTEGGQHDR